jgi:TrmH family RNA methyltransferase
VRKRSLRWSEGVCVLEGPDLITAALAAGAEFEGVYVEESATSRDGVGEVLSAAESSGVRVFALSDGVIEKVADAQTPQPLMAAVRFSVRDLASLSGPGPILALHEVRDPGNAGTAIRTADATGAAAVVFTGESVDPYNPKTLRATAGSIFHVPVVVAPHLRDLTNWHRGRGPSYGAVVRDGRDFRSLDLAGNSLIVFGNESAGLSADDLGTLDGALTIPMAGESESLNVAVAVGVVLFEALFQFRVREQQSLSRPT